MADSTTDERAQALGEQLITAHDEFRGELARLREQLDSFLAGGGSADTPAPPALDHQLRTNCLSFCEHLHGHHTAEDTRLFPYLEEHYPTSPPLSPGCATSTAPWAASWATSGPCWRKRPSTTPRASGTSSGGCPPSWRST